MYVCTAVLGEIPVCASAPPYLTSHTGAMVSPSKDEIGYDGKPISPCALRLPAARKTGVTAADQQKLIQRALLVRIVDQLVKEPKYIFPIHAQLLVTGLDAPVKSPEKAAWHGEYKFLNQIPRAWLAEFVLQEATKLNIAVVNATLLGRLESEDADNIPTLFSFMVQLPMAAQFPKELRDPYVAKLAFRKRCENVGNRLAKFVELGGITSTSALDMRRAGCFVLDFDATTNLCTRITHITGVATALAAHAPISRGFQLMDNTLDAKAAVVLEPRKDFLHMLMKDAAFTREMWIPGKKSNILRDLSVSVASAVQQQDEERAAAKVSNSETMLPAAKHRAEVATQKAREHLKQAAEKRKRRRLCTLAVDSEPTVTTS